MKSLIVMIILIVLASVGIGFFIRWLLNGMHKSIEEEFDCEKYHTEKLCSVFGVSEEHLKDEAPCPYCKGIHTHDLGLGLMECFKCLKAFREITPQFIHDCDVSGKV